MTQVLGQILFNKPPPQQMSGLPPINQTQTPFQIIKSSPSLFTNGNHKMLDEVVEKSQKVLMCIKATFPFELFPDVLTIDENKVTLFCREPGYENVHGVFIENITYVTVDTSFIHSTLNITDSTSERFPKILSIHHLKKDDAFRARSLIEGLIAAKKLNINFTIFEPEELVDKLVQLGEAKKMAI